MPQAYRSERSETKPSPKSLELSAVSPGSYLCEASKAPFLTIVQGTLVLDVESDLPYRASSPATPVPY